MYIPKGISCDRDGLSCSNGAKGLKGVSAISHSYVKRVNAVLSYICFARSIAALFAVCVVTSLTFQDLKGCLWTLVSVDGFDFLVYL